MDLLPKIAHQFSEKQYWENFFAKQGTEAFEWYGEYPQLCTILNKYVRVKDNILVAGCGNSTLSADMWNVGYKSMVSVDISDVVIRQMQNKYKPLGMTFSKMDLMNLEFPDKEFTCVLDKGTLDAIFADEEEDTVQKVEATLKEIGRVLKVGGRYVCVSLLQGHILRKLLQWFPDRGWMVRICRCREAEDTTSGGVAFPVFVVVCTKFEPPPDVKPMRILELSVQDEKPRRLADAAALIAAVTEMQQYAFLRSSLTTQGSGDDVTLQLCDVTTDQPRFTLHVVDRWRKKTNKAFAIFIVQQGRETEWLFGSPAGRRQLADTAGFDRLLVVHLHREQRYGSLQDVQEELSAHALQMKPAHIRDGVQVPFLTSGSDLGRREVRCSGSSALSGRYLVEDVHLDTDAIHRRLVFLSNVNVIQSETRLRRVGKQGGGLEVDPDYLSCRHHRYLVAGVALSPADPAHVLVLGLGGGALPQFIHSTLTQTRVDAVDIDPEVVTIAREWFGFSETDRLRAHVADGIDFIHETRTQGRRYDVIIFDVDCKDSSLGMSCPPEAFVRPCFLSDVRHCLSQEGVFLLNLVARDQTLKQKVHDDLRSVFPACVAYEVPEEVNEVVYCFVTPRSDDVMSLVRDSAARVNSQVVGGKSKKKRENFIDVMQLAGQLRKL